MSAEPRSPVSPGAPSGSADARPARLKHFIAGLEGIALLRHWLVGDRAQAERRFEALRRLLRSDAPGIALEPPELDVVDGYARWAASYDGTPNPLIEVEEPVVRARIDALPPGRALDAACGSGRHTAYLCARGHQVYGVDASPHMLERARKRAPGADLREGDLTRLPFEDAHFDVAVCSLALTHCADLGPPIRELARVLRPGGRLILSDQHPAMTGLGNTALFLDAALSPAIVKSHAHLHSDYLDAFRSSALDVRGCDEPRYTEAHLPTLLSPLPRSAHGAVTAGMLGLPAALIWELRSSSPES